MSWCGLAERCRNAATNNTRAKENHETDVNGFFFFSIKHMVSGYIMIYLARGLWSMDECAASAAVCSSGML